MKAKLALPAVAIIMLTLFCSTVGASVCLPGYERELAERVYKNHGGKLEAVTVERPVSAVLRPVLDEVLNSKLGVAARRHIGETIFWEVTDTTDSIAAVVPLRASRCYALVLKQKDFNLQNKPSKADLAWLRTMLRHEFIHVMDDVGGVAGDPILSFDDEWYYANSRTRTELARLFQSKTRAAIALGGPELTGGYYKDAAMYGETVAYVLSGWADLTDAERLEIKEKYPALAATVDRSFSKLRDAIAQ